MKVMPKVIPFSWKVLQGTETLKWFTFGFPISFLSAHEIEHDPVRKGTHTGMVVI